MSSLLDAYVAAPKFLQQFLNGFGQILVIYGDRHTDGAIKLSSVILLTIIIFRVAVSSSGLNAYAVLVALRGDDDLLPVKLVLLNEMLDR